MMHRTKRFAVSLFLAASIVAPASIMAAPSPQAAVSVRVYDSGHKDYHNWDDHENGLWAQFLVEKHRSHHEYAKASKREQAEYWNWRHDHHD